MNIFRLTLAFLLAGSVYSSADAQVYPSAAIPDSLKKNADAVIREYTCELDIYSASSAAIQVKKVITVLNKKGEVMSDFRVFYDRFISPSDIKIQLYDASGIQLKKVKDSEILDYSAYDDGTLFSDNRVKYFKPLVNTYPYTIVYSYDLKLKGYTGFSSWIPAGGYSVSVQHAIYKVTVAQEVGLRYKQLNFTEAKRKSTDNNKQEYTWELNNFPAIQEEPLSPGFDLLTPVVLITTDKFEYDGSNGDISSWALFGDWIASLLQGRDILPELTRMKVHALTDSIPGTFEKSRVLYEYMQKRMRYISIQLGIGGYQPFPAEMVDKLSYGDCKALSNYYIALLKEAGISALYAVTVAESGTPEFFSDFPANIYFNHAIVCLPMQADSVWFECTSKYSPAGFMNSQVAGHPALLATPAGGKVVTVPTLPRDKNTEFRKIMLRVNPDGSAFIKLTIRYAGLQLSSGLSDYILNTEEQTKMLYEDLGLNDFVINKHKYTYHKNGDVSIQLDADITCNHLGSINERRMVVPVKMLGDQMELPEKVVNRKFPFELDFPYQDCDTVVMETPLGYTVESLPAGYQSESEFGEYQLRLISSDNKLTIIRSLKMNKGEYPPEKYNSLMEFLQGIRKAEKQKIIFGKKD
jgi:hypothetical protein